MRPSESLLVLERSLRVNRAIHRELISAASAGTAPCTSASVKGREGVLDSPAPLVHLDLEALTLFCECRVPRRCSATADRVDASSTADANAEVTRDNSSSSARSSVARARNGAEVVRQRIEVTLALQQCRHREVASGRIPAGLRNMERDGLFHVRQRRLEISQLLLFGADRQLQWKVGSLIASKRHCRQRLVDIAVAQ